jgi:hypothetical protein
MAFVFFAVTRFRLPVVAVLLPWAGAGLGLISSREILTAVRRGSLAATAAAGLAALAVLVAVVPAIQVQAIALGVQRWDQQAPFRQAEQLLRAGDVPAAITLYQRANISLPDTRYGLAAALLQSGDARGALAQLVQNEPEDRFEPFIIRGEVEWLLGDVTAARNYFSARRVKVAADSALEWAWDHLRPPEVSHIDVGSGLDMGYVRGFYGAETAASGQDYRWSGSDFQVRGLSPGSHVMVDVSGWRPGGTAKPLLALPAGERITLPASDQWQDIDLGAVPDSSTSTHAATDPFIGSGSDPRLLGVRVARFSVGP